MSNTKLITMIILSVIGVAIISALVLTVEPEKVQPEKIQPDSDNQSSPKIKVTTTQDEYESNLENSKNAQLMPTGTIDKKIESGHIFGFTADNGLMGGMTSTILSNSGEKFSMRFTSKFSGEVTKLIIFADGQENVKARVGLQEDDLGTPSGQWVGNFAEVILNFEGAKFDVIDLPGDTYLKEDQIYHIVVELEEQVLDNRFFFITYHSNWPFTPFNYKDPDLTWDDNAINTLYFDGVQWETLDRWPIYVIEYSDGISDGQPYSLMAPWVIKGSSMVGQTLRPFSSYLVDELAFVVSSHGNPNDDLHYTVYDEENNILRSGIFATKEDLTEQKSWRQVKLDSPLFIESGKLYRFVLSSQSQDVENCYKVYGHEFMLDGSLGYGLVTHHLTKSTDGIKWSKWYDADTAFKLITK